MTCHWPIAATGLDRGIGCGFIQYLNKTAPGGALLPASLAIRALRWARAGGLCRPVGVDCLSVRRSVGRRIVVVRWGWRRRRPLPRAAGHRLAGPRPSAAVLPRSPDARSGRARCRVAPPGPVCRPAWLPQACRSANTAGAAARTPGHNPGPPPRLSRLLQGGACCGRSSRRSGGAGCDPARPGGGPAG